MKINRRSFLKRLLIILGSVEAFFLIKNGINNKSALKKNKHLVSVGKADSFEIGKIYPFISDRFYLRRFKDGGFIALSVKCTHLGCVLNINADTDGFICPCHSSQFNSVGEVTASPASRPLDIFPIIVEKGELLVDTSKPQTRSSFEKSQLTYIS